MANLNCDLGAGHTLDTLVPCPARKTKCIEMHMVVQG